MVTGRWMCAHYRDLGERSSVDLTRSFFSEHSSTANGLPTNLEDITIKGGSRPSARLHAILHANAPVGFSGPAMSKVGTSSPT